MPQRYNSSNSINITLYEKHYSNYRVFPICPQFKAVQGQFNKSYKCLHLYYFFFQLNDKKYSFQVARSWLWKQTLVYFFKGLVKRIFQQVWLLCDDNFGSWSPGKFITNSRHVGYSILTLICKRFTYRCCKHVIRPQFLHCPLQTPPLSPWLPLRDVHVLV